MFASLYKHTMAAADAHCAATSDGAMCSTVANNIRNHVPLSLTMRDDTVQLYAACRAFEHSNAACAEAAAPNALGAAT